MSSSKISNQNLSALEAELSVLLSIEQQLALEASQLERNEPRSTPPHLSGLEYDWLNAPPSPRATPIPRQRPCRDPPLVPPGPSAASREYPGVHHPFATDLRARQRLHLPQPSAPSSSLPRPLPSSHHARPSAPSSSLPWSLPPADADAFSHNTLYPPASTAAPPPAVSPALQDAFTNFISFRKHLLLSLETDCGDSGQTVKPPATEAAASSTPAALGRTSPPRSSPENGVALVPRPEEKDEAPRPVRSVIGVPVEKWRAVWEAVETASATPHGAGHRPPAPSTHASPPSIPASAPSIPASAPSVALQPPPPSTPGSEVVAPPAAVDVADPASPRPLGGDRVGDRSIVDSVDAVGRHAGVAVPDTLGDFVPFRWHSLDRWVPPPTLSGGLNDFCHLCSHTSGSAFGEPGPAPPHSAEGGGSGSVRHSQPSFSSPASQVTPAGTAPSPALLRSRTNGVSVVVHSEGAAEAGQASDSDEYYNRSDILSAAIRDLRLAVPIAMPTSVYPARIPAPPVDSSQISVPSPPPSARELSSFDVFASNNRNSSSSLLGRISKAMSGVAAAEGALFVRCGVSLNEHSDVRPVDPASSLEDLGRRVEMISMRTRNDPLSATVASLQAPTVEAHSPARSSKSAVENQALLANALELWDEKLTDILRKHGSALSPEALSTAVDVTVPVQTPYGSDLFYGPLRDSWPAPAALNDTAFETPHLPADRHKDSLAPSFRSQMATPFSIDQAYAVSECSGRASPAVVSPVREARSREPQAVEPQNVSVLDPSPALAIDDAPWGGRMWLRDPPTEVCNSCNAAIPADAAHFRTDPATCIPEILCGGCAAAPRRKDAHVPLHGFPANPLTLVEQRPPSAASPANQMAVTQSAFFTPEASHMNLGIASARQLTSVERAATKLLESARLRENEKPSANRPLRTPNLSRRGSVVTAAVVAAGLH